MDTDPSQRAPRKLTFTPKKLDPRRNKPVQTKPDEAMVDEDKADDEVPEHLIRRVHEHLTRERPKVEKKAKEVAFIHGSSQLKTFGRQREDSGQRDSAAPKDSGRDNKQNLLSLPLIAKTDGVAESTGTCANPLSQKKKEYKEPWDYNHSYYPITLPLRRPYSGDPELLDAAEFGEANENLKYDENSIHAASNLGLLEETDDPQLIFLQLPAKLPRIKLLAGGDRRETTDMLIDTGQGIPAVTSSVSDHAKAEKILGSSGKRTPSIRECSLEELPRGHMGKMLVYKSGAVKLKLGDVMYDVSPGSDCTFAQNVVAMNTVHKQCCDLGELRKRAVVTPDIDFLLKQDNQ